MITPLDLYLLESMLCSGNVAVGDLRTPALLLTHCVGHFRTLGLSCHISRTKGEATSGDVNFLLLLVMRRELGSKKAITEALAGKHRRPGLCPLKHRMCMRRCV